MTLRDGELESAGEMAAAMRAGEVASFELVERAVYRAERWQPATNAFSQLWGEEALEEARRVDARPAAARGPMAGVPIAVKDLFDVAGHETTGCCRAYRGRLARRDADMIQRVRRAGLVMIGKTNQHELAAGGSNVVSACGRTRNPWDGARMTGGSSGGSAAAVVSGVVPWALGSDTGGSIRIPSALCGAFGLKPTTGRLSIAGMLPLAPSMDCPGPIAATATDTRSLLRILAGDPESDRGSGDTPVPRPAYRVALVERFVTDRVHPAVGRALGAAAEALTEGGVEMEAIDGRGLEDARRIWMWVCCPEFVSAHRGIRRRLVAPAVVEWMEIGERLTGEQRAEAEHRRVEIGRWFDERLQGVDALLVPTTAYPAPPADADRVDLGGLGTVALSRLGPGWLTCPVNLAGLPAISLPAGRSGEGLPVGVTLVGKEDSDPLLLAAAALWERAAGHRPERPGLPPSER